MSPPYGNNPYRAAGVDYEILDEGKRRALAEAMRTSPALHGFGGKALDASRGEPAFVFEVGGLTLGFVLEGLGTKSMIAHSVHAEMGLNRFDAIAYDTVAAIVNDLICVAALPMVVNAYFAAGASEWFENQERMTALLAGWRRACDDAGCVWGGGESPSLAGLVAADEIELAGSSVGLIDPARGPIFGADLDVGDDIVLVASTGLHANGSSLARKIADALPDKYATSLASGRTFGEALLDPSNIYVPLVRDLLAGDVPVTYLSHVTGHGLLKIMRPAKQLTYRLTRLPPVPEVLDFMAAESEMSARIAYSTLNMGAGFAVYCRSGAGQAVVAHARRLGLSAILAGTVESGPRRVIIEPVDVVFESEQMLLRDAASDAP